MNSEFFLLSVFYMVGIPVARFSILVQYLASSCVVVYTYLCVCVCVCVCVVCGACACVCVCECVLLPIIQEVSLNSVASRRRSKSCRKRY